MADLGHHVAADALERAQHELMVAHDVAHHHVVEAHVPVAAESLDDGVGAAHEELIEAGAAISLGEYGADDGARRLVGLADIDVPAQDGSRWAAGARRRGPIELELPPEILVRCVLPRQPGIAEPSRAL